MQQLLDTVPRNSIPDQLIYDTYVIDEAGRLCAGWALLYVGFYYYIHEMYDTGMTKPVIIPVGSVTQSSVINDTCDDACGVEYCEHRKIPINNYSMLSMITNTNLIYRESIFVKHNKHNRRMKTGDPVRSAKLSIMRNCLETGDPIPEEVMKYIRENMSVDKEQYYNNKCIHLAQTHRGCLEVLNADKKAAEKEILCCVESLTHRGDFGPTTLRECSAPAGAMFKSANYMSKDWVKSITENPLTHGCKMIYSRHPSDIKKFSTWNNIRRFYANRPYTVTHKSSCQVLSIIGSWNDLLSDLEDYEMYMEENPLLLKEFIYAIQNSLYRYYCYSDEMHRKISDCTDELNTIDELTRSLYDLKNILLNTIKKSITDGFEGCKPVGKPLISHNVHNDSVNKVKMDVQKGEIVYIQEKKYQSSPRSPLVIKVGKTISLLLYSYTIKISHPLEYYIKNDKFISKAGYKRKNNGLTIENEDPKFTIDDFLDLHQNCETHIVNSDEDAESAFAAEMIENAKDFTVLDIYPLKHNLAMTVAASQGMTINAEVYGKVDKKISAYNLIVMSSRSSSSNNLWFYFEDPKKGVIITPLDKTTSNTIKKLVYISNKCSGFL